MDTWLSQYKAVIYEQPPLDDSWFQTDLKEARAGDDIARRRILGSSLRVAFDIVERSWKPGGGIDLVDLLQDANRVMECALLSFSGNNTEEYVQHLEQAIRVSVDTPGK